MCKAKNKDGCFIFKLDESGVSIRGVPLKNEKCLISNRIRSDTKGLRVRGSMIYVPLLPHESATWQVYTPIVVLPEK